jgi:hypothetical protein
MSVHDQTPADAQEGGRNQENDQTHSLYQLSRSN